ncbi:DNA-binding MarR family transcriptional regulator [Rhizobium aquaticum]|uniref:DNA-binding MarR family transcriptional regulator n=1 Tax=Rhizobium aquaticum TaxID=1549636 RepID=A0ABV2IUP1_9HYPH
MSGVSDLTAHTGYWMRMISNAVSQDFARRVAGEGVTVAEWVFLRALYDEPSLSPTLLAEKMGMTKGAISKLAERLIEKGLVTRAEDEKDRRAHHLALAAEGRAKVPQLAALADANDAEAFGVLSAEERAELDRLLKALAERRGLSSVPTD